MNFYIQQSIHIQTIKIGSLANSCVFQIGSSGIIKPSSHLYNTGGFTGPAPKTGKPTTIIQGSEGGLLASPAVPL
ncbi:spore germination protein GerPB [Bacillus massilinigeriensis]|uniref:spore germination protein GerPB n=1 Tax=Bacillus massilionigeriensis TaxID=1805475 RepID=UPI00096AF478|nr:spore germination protein GerPB [Bacillus massilionigeriensis]